MYVMMFEKTVVALLPILFVSRLQMWQMMTMTSLIRAGLSGLCLRKASSGGGGARESLGRGRYRAATGPGESAPGAVDAAPAA